MYQYLNISYLSAYISYLLTGIHLVLSKYLSKIFLTLCVSIYIYLLSTFILYVYICLSISLCLCLCHCLSCLSAPHSNISLSTRSIYFATWTLIYVLHLSPFELVLADMFEYMCAYVCIYVCICVCMCVCVWMDAIMYMFVMFENLHHM